MRNATAARAFRFTTMPAGLPVSKTVIEPPFPRWNGGFIFAVLLTSTCDFAMHSPYFKSRMQGCKDARGTRGSVFVGLDFANVVEFTISNLFVLSA